MTILHTALDPYAPSCVENRKAMLACLDEVAAAVDQAREGGGERYVTRHHARGKLLPRERIGLLVDQDSPFLELSPMAAWGTEFPVGASVVTGIGVVCGVACVVVANDPTVRGGAVNPYTVAKICRAEEVAVTSRLPLIHLVESGGGPTAAAPERRRPWTIGVPAISVVLGDTTGDTSYAPGRYDHTIVVRNRERDGLADYLAEDERDALRLTRLCVRRSGWQKRAPRTTRPAPPRYDPDDLLAIPSAHPPQPFDPREVLARILDGSEFDEFKPACGSALVTGWGKLHGYPLGILAHTGEPLGFADTHKAARFANATAVPLLILQNAPTGREPIPTPRRPHITVTIGAWPTPSEYRPEDPRFLFAWPNAGPVDDPSAGRPASALARAGRIHDDGVIDPRDTRTVLGFCLSTIDTPTGEET